MFCGGRVHAPVPVCGGPDEGIRDAVHEDAACKAGCGHGSPERGEIQDRAVCGRLCPVPGAGIVHKARGVGRGARTACGGMRMAVRCGGPGGGGVVCGLPGAVQEDNGAGKKGGE